MKEVRALHHKAMDLVDRADRARLENQEQRAAELLGEAFEVELQAASLLSSRIELEPSRSILYRSAASLAIECGQPREALRLVEMAMAGHPPIEIVEELKELLARAELDLSSAEADPIRPGTTATLTPDNLHRRWRSWYFAAAATVLLALTLSILLRSPPPVVHQVAVFDPDGWSFDPPPEGNRSTGRPPTQEEMKEWYGRYRTQEDTAAKRALKEHGTIPRVPKWRMFVVLSTDQPCSALFIAVDDSGSAHILYPAKEDESSTSFGPGLHFVPRSPRVLTNDFEHVERQNGFELPTEAENWRVLVAVRQTPIEASEYRMISEYIHGLPEEVLDKVLGALHHELLRRGFMVSELQLQQKHD